MAIRTLVKVAVLISLMVYAQAHMSEQLQSRGRQLAFLRNLPHRYLGMLYYSWLLQQHRTDYLAQYAINWNIAVRDRGAILEGMTKPVVTLLILKQMQDHPEDEALRRLGKLMVKQEFKDRAENLMPAQPVIDTAPTVLGESLPR